MALVVETGEGLADSESFVTVEEVRAFASSRGKVLPVADADVEASIRLAHDYIGSFEPRFKGWRRVSSQALAFPRNGLYIYNVLQTEGVIPVALKNAISQMVLELQTLDALPSFDGSVVVSEAVGPISTTYAASGESGPIPTFPKVMAFLAPLLGSTGLSTVRA